MVCCCCNIISCTLYFHYLLHCGQKHHSFVFTYPFSSLWINVISSWFVRSVLKSWHKPDQSVWSLHLWHGFMNQSWFSLFTSIMRIFHIEPCFSEPPFWKHPSGPDAHGQTDMKGCWLDNYWRAPSLHSGDGHSSQVCKSWAEPRRQWGISDSRLTSPGSCGQEQHSEEETSQWITGGCCFSLGCGVFVCGWLPFMSYLTTWDQRAFLGPHPQPRCHMVPLEDGIVKTNCIFGNTNDKAGQWWC